MAAKTFHVERPDQLRELSKLAKDGRLGAMAAVWSANVKRTGGGYAVGQCDFRWLFRR